MDRQKALEIMGLHENVSPEEITKRYDVLFKKYRFADSDNNGITKLETEEAYRLLMGLDFHDPEDERKKQARLAHPNRLFKLLKIDEEKVSNFIYYYKWKVIIGIVAFAAVLSIILSIVNRVEPDLKVVLAGEIVMQDTTPLRDSIIAEIEGVEAVQLQVITLSDKLDPQMQSISVQKFSLELMNGKNDIFIMDKKTYREYASFGAFIPLDDKLKEFGITNYNRTDLEIAIETEDGETHPVLLYGVDVSNSPLLRDFDILGDTLIAALRLDSDNPENAEIYLRKLIESVK